MCSMETIINNNDNNKPLIFLVHINQLGVTSSSNLDLNLQLLQGSHLTFRFSNEWPWTWGGGEHSPPNFIVRSFQLGATRLES